MKGMWKNFLCEKNKMEHKSKLKAKESPRKEHIFSYALFITKLLVNGIKGGVIYTGKMETVGKIKLNLVTADRRESEKLLLPSHTRRTVRLPYTLKLF